MLSSQMLLLHTQDLLDQRIIENGGFQPNYQVGCVETAINEIIDMMKLTLTKKIEIVLAYS